MIVRAVLDNPELLLNFDWFNDGRDTIGWLQIMAARKFRPYPEVQRILFEAERLFEQWQVMGSRFNLPADMIGGEPKYYGRLPE